MGLYAPTDSQIQFTHIQNADTNAAIVAAASATQRIYVIKMYYRNGSGGNITPTLVSNSLTMFGATAQATATSAFYDVGGMPCSAIAQNVTFTASASATSDLTVWWYYGP